jgi:uncharacterized protein (DUF58 family)
MEFTASRRLLHIGALLALVGFAAFIARDWVPAAAAVPLLGLLVFSLIEVVLPLPRAGARKVGTGDRMLLDDEVPVVVRFRTVPAPVNLELEDDVPEGLRRIPRSMKPVRATSQGTEAEYMLGAIRRGTHQFETARVARRGWLGLFTRRVTLPVASEVQVLPASARNLGVRVRPRPPSRVGVTTHVVRRGPGDEFFALRQYQPGDSMGDVNWKASARMNRIITNEFLPEEPARYLLYVDARAHGHEANQQDVFERSLELSSILVEALVQARAQVGLVTLSFHSTFLTPGGGQGQLNRLRSMIQNCVPGQPAPIRDLVVTNLAHLPARAEAILVTSDIYDPTLRDAILALRARHGRVTAIAPGYPEPAGDDLDSIARRASAALLNAEQAAALAGLVGYAHRATQWPPDEPIAVTLARLGMTRGMR